MLRKNQRSPKISRFVMICLLQLRLIFLLLLRLACLLQLRLILAYFLLLLRLSCLLQLRLIFCCSCILHCTYSRQRERERVLKKEMKSKKQKVRWVLLLFVVPKRVDVISKCVVVGNLGICRIKNVWRGKNIKWAMILLLMVHLLFVI